MEKRFHGPWIREFMNVIRSDRAGMISLIILLSLAIFGLAGPLIYRVDPYQTIYSYQIRVYNVSLDERTYKEIYYSEPEELKSILYSDKTLYIVDSKYDIYMIDLSRGASEKIARADPSSFIGLISLDGDIALLEIIGGRIRISSLQGEWREDLEIPGNLGISRESQILFSGGDLIILRLETGGIALINISSRSIEKINPRINVSTAEICWDRYVILGGLKGWIASYDLYKRELVISRPFTDDIRYVYCSSDRIYILGRFGFIAYSDKDLENFSMINTGVVEDLVSAVRYRNSIAVLGSGGSIIIIYSDQESHSIYSFDIRNSMKLYSSKEDLYVVAYGVYAMQLKPPSLSHPLGTDYLGRDLLAQIMIGVRMSLAIALLVALIVLFIGAGVGIVAGYFRGRADLILNSIINFMYSIPLEPFAILLALILRPGLETVVLAISLLIWRTTARIIRSQVISISSTPMIESARALGASHTRIIIRYIIPALLPIIMIDFANVVVYAILAESTLSFLGVGAQNIFTLGSILNQAMITGSWRIGWWLLTPGFFIGAIAFSLYTLARIFEPVANPRLKNI
ncbi:MAG: ABC transporter permease [Sulfolobales archaeon]